MFHDPAIQRTTETVVAVSVTSAALGALPLVLSSLVALVGIVFYSIQIWESRTLQNALRRWRGEGQRRPDDPGV